MAEHVDNQSQGLLGKQTSTQYYIPGVALSRGRHVFDGLHKGSLACPLGIERFSPESTRRSIVEHDCSLSPFTGICSPKAYRRRTKYSQLPKAIFPLDQAGVMPAVMETRLTTFVTPTDAGDQTNKAASPTRSVLALQMSPVPIDDGFEKSARGFDADHFSVIW
ncbi:hypothetical protein BDV35DRAFT_399156 [Aspergillus flavus]|uniref:Uncharacterized protein n=1 Tax=Aspergillus flavus TaxID=5059 RepID=A0A5N6GHC9_ASPFL|nr:hypothetical protein BDV35DRAFT_399156 [Aspergillus flavus]